MIVKQLKKINSNKKYYLAGDMGYIINEERKLKLSKNVTMVIPKIKNQKNTINNFRKIKIKKYI